MRMIGFQLAATDTSSDGTKVAQGLRIMWRDQLAEGASSVLASSTLPYPIAGGTSTEASADSLESVDLAMSRYADGDARAFSEVFSALAPRLGAFLWRLSGSRAVADDLMQETFLRMHRARGSFARGRRVTPWAYAIARNCYVSEARSARARHARHTTDSAELELPAPDANAEETTAAKQSAEAVQQALAAMTEARREAFILLRYEGLSVAEAAQIVGITESALKVRAFHAYESIRAALDEMTRSNVSTHANARRS